MSNSSDPAEPEEPDVTPEEESWATTIEHGIEEIRTQPADVLFVDVLKIDLPYIVMLSMAVLGIGIVTFTGQPVAFYWEFLTPVYCAICILSAGATPKRRMNARGWSGPKYCTGQRFSSACGSSIRRRCAA